MLSWGSTVSSSFFFFFFFFSFSFHFAVIQAISCGLNNIFDDNFIDQWMRSVSLIHVKLKDQIKKMGEIRGLYTCLPTNSYIYSYQLISYMMSCVCVALALTREQLAFYISYYLLLFNSLHD